MKKDQDNLEKLPPQNIEAEQSLLGCLLLDKDAIIRVIDSLSDKDFYKHAHQLIYDTMRELYNAHEPIDILTLSSRLKEKGVLDKIGGKSYLAKLSNLVATAANIVSYAGIVQRKATLRRLQTAASNIMELSYDEEREIDSSLDEAEQLIFKVSQKYAKNSFLKIDNLLLKAFDRIDDLHKSSGAMRGLPTGFTDLDHILSGLQKTDLVVLAARPSVGKTTFVLDICRQAATKARKSVGIFSLEMGQEQLVDKMLCAEAGIGLWKMRTGRLEDNDFAEISRAMETLSTAPIYIDDSASCSVMDIRAKCRRLQMEKGLDLVVIDYLQLMEGRSKSSDNRVQEVSEISRGLKQLARELDVPVIALSQLARAVEQEKPAIPKLAHLRESGSIEQDADIVMFIYRKAADRNFDKNSLSENERHLAEVHIAKHRNGPTGKVDLFFNEESVKFENWSRDYNEGPPAF